MRNRVSTFRYRRAVTALLLAVASFGASAIDMPLLSVDGRKVNLDQYRGQWVVVNYWATWCPPCITEMPELQEFHDRHKDEDAIVIGINSELIGKQQLLNFLDDYFITYPVFMAGPTQESELGLVPGLPTTFMVNPTGEVVARQVGPVTRDMLEQFLERHSTP